MRAIWNGAIGFGLVNIPIKLYSAVEDSSLDLDMLDKTDHSHIKYKRVNENTGKEVKWENIVKGYEMEGRYIVLEEEDFIAASPEKTRVFSILQFVKEEEIDAVYFETPYFMEPQKNSESPYNLLLKALMETKMVGVGTFVLREKESLAVIRTYLEKYLILQKIRFYEEIRSPEELKTKQTKPKPEEVKMAVALIEQLSDTFNPKKYKDTYTEELLEIIHKKANGTKIRKIKPIEEKTPAVDIMSQLKASLEASHKNKKIS